MKLTATRNELLKPIQTVMPAVERKATLPILQHVYIKATDQGTRFIANDMEIEIAATSPISAEKPGETTLPAKRLHDILRAFPDDASVTITIDDGKATVKSGRSRFTLQHLPAEEYPATTDREFATKITVDKLELSQALIGATYCMAAQDVRYYLCGCLFSFSAGVLKTIATDGHRLGIQEVAAQIDGEETGEVILPIKGVQSLMKLLNDSGEKEGQVALQVGKNHLRMEYGNTCLTSKLIDGKFPDVQRVIPRNADKIVLADRVLLKNALARAGIVLNDKTTGIALQFDDWMLRAKAKNIDQEEAEEEVEINYNGGPLEIGFNVRYVLDALNAVQGEMVKISLTDTASSIKLEGAEGDSGIHVVMPMML